MAVPHYDTTIARARLLEDAVAVCLLLHTGWCIFLPTSY